MRLPDYDRSLLSITSSIYAHYGEQMDSPTLPEIDDMLKRPTRTVILILLDGMGENLIKRFLPAHAFLNRFDVGPLSSVYPSTTTAATTSLWTGLSPAQHGWIGWSLYFKECGRQIDAFLDRDGLTHDKYKYLSPAETYMPLKSAYARLKDKVQTHTIFPFATYAATGAEYKHTVESFTDYVRVIRSLANEPKQKLICAYFPEPDHNMHGAGVAAASTRALFDQLNAQVEKLCVSLPEDALVIVTADHGLVDVTEHVVVNEIPELMECLWMPPSVESRAASFFVKPRMRAQFERAFDAYLGADFQLFTHEQVFETKLLGGGMPHPKVDDFIGDYFVCATGTRAISYHTPASDPSFKLIGQHAGLTDDEMLVPLVLYRTGMQS